METGIPHKEQHVPLSVAAVLLHVSVMGRRPEASAPFRLSATLNDVARALAMVAPIYAADSKSGLPVMIQDSILITATFVQGAQVLVAADGTRYEGLSAKRGDIEDAAKIFAATRALHNQFGKDGPP